jgi:hypothetical protein
VISAAWATRPVISRRDYCCAGAAQWLVDRLTRRGIILDRRAHLLVAAVPIWKQTHAIVEKLLPRANCEELRVDLANTSPVSRRARARARETAGNQRPWPADKVERWSIDRLIPYAKNARTHTDAQVAAIAASIKEWGTPCIYDAQGTLVGIPTPVGDLTRQVSGNWYQLGYLISGVEDFGLFYFASLDCTGQPFVQDFGQLPKPGTYDGHTLWSTAIGAIPAVFTWASYQYTDPKNGPTCQPYGPCGPQGQSCEATGSQAVKVETRQFYAPFTMR